MIFKFALRNLLRFPWRTLLYGFVIFFIIMIMTASFFVWNACEGAVDALDENYVFIASLVKRESVGIPLSEVFKCIDYEKITAFNVTMSEGNGAIPSGTTITEAPCPKTDGTAVGVLFEDDACELYGVENLALIYSFYSGECTIREGTSLTKKGYTGKIDEIVIPWYVADKYGIEVGDTINRRYYKQVGAYGYIYIPTVVVGIYETSAHAPDTEAYPAYIPLSVAEIDYAHLLGTYQKTVADYTIDRADFVLAGRNDFEDFVIYANENGVDFKSTNIVFNNSTYDVLTSALENVNMITLFVLGIVFVVGLGVFIFLTVYLCNSRAKERILLMSLGMKKMQIHGMIALELCFVIVFFTLLGMGVGYIAASEVCDFVNNTVLARASVSEKIQDLNSATEFEVTMPLEKNMKIQIFTDEAHISDNDIAFNQIEMLEENEIGVSRHRLYIYKTDSEMNMYKPPQVPTAEEEYMFLSRNRPAVDIIGISDLSYFELTDKWDDLPEQVIRLYVSEDFPYVNEYSVFFLEFNVGDWVLNDISNGEITTVFLGKTAGLVIAGTYKENEYVSGNDIIVHMDDYHKIYAGLSITDEEHYFKRVGEIYSKESE